MLNRSAKIEFGKFSSAPKKNWLPCSLLLSAMLLSGCKDIRASLIGRYQGTETVNGKAVQVVTYLPKISDKTSSFSLFPILANAKGITYSAQILDSKSLLLSGDRFPKGGISLAINGSCATGERGGTLTVRACWTEGNISIELRDKSRSGNSISLSLKKDTALPAAKKDAPGAYSLDELLGRAKFLGYPSMEEAVRVYRAKQNIGVARGNLLPRLNVGRVLGALGGDLTGLIGTVLPFLFPSNWYKLQESEDLYQAERFSFASLRGNEMNAVEGVYYVILRDQSLLANLSHRIEWMKQLQNSLADAEEKGTIEAGTAEYFGTKIILLESDQRELTAYLDSLLMELGYSVALPPMDGIKAIDPLNLPDLTAIAPIEARPLVEPAKNVSFEIATLKKMYNASLASRGAATFDFLDPESSGGLGFGTPSQIQVAKSYSDEIKIKMEETKSLVELKVAKAAQEHNLALSAYAANAKSLALTEKRMQYFIEKKLQGDKSLDGEQFVDQLADLGSNAIGFAADETSSIYRWLLAKSKLERLLLKGYYSQLDAALP